MEKINLALVYGGADDKKEKYIVQGQFLILQFLLMEMSILALLPLATNLLILEILDVQLSLNYGIIGSGV